MNQSSVAHLYGIDLRLQTCCYVFRQYNYFCDIITYAMCSRHIINNYTDVAIGRSSREVNETYTYVTCV